MLLRSTGQAENCRCGRAGLWENTYSRVDTASRGHWSHHLLGSGTAPRGC